ncbi:hypothetical protein AJ79_04003 [Helicocarpus griseus UAMH5409]|uniref:Glucose-methanol-choline oxidoreductase N-terminal domain-containing protein n=1 Tax=Helicocarpus griseus UAMH5409 TaxID=1447875 RepID=A0A2B7XVT3_9EURO|nr:hypothetical protein AJ79_04003 [Helicocarpus griseus UAMH5409]
MPTSAQDAIAFSEIDFDYIIVGGGTAGLTVAARLSEDSSLQIGVLEAGELRQDDPAISTPFRSFSLLENPAYDWMFKTIPQKQLNNRSVDWPRGKVVGGSSAINFQSFVRGAPTEYDDWEALGNEGWNWKNLCPYFKKVESFTPIPNGEASARGAYRLSDHGRDGTINTTITDDFASPIYNLWQSTWDKLGVPTVPTAGERTVGVQSWMSSIDAVTGTRSSSLTAYYNPNAARPNLRLLPEASVLSVAFQTEANELVASGVRFIVGDKEYMCRARKEVILAAGTIQSPGILERSGIGSRDILDEHGIEILFENRGVGENLQDHILTAMGYEVSDERYSLDATVGSPERIAAAMAEYQETRSGLFARGSTVGAFTSYEQTGQAVATLEHTVRNSPASSSIQKQHDIQLKRLRDPNIPAFQWAVSPFYMEMLFQEPKPADAKGCIAVVSGVSAPFSRGSIHITSNRPKDSPEIDPRYLEHKADIQLLTAASRQSARLTATAPLSGAIGRVLLPAKPLITDEDYEKHARHVLSTYFHPIGTCSMLPLEDGGVVDSRLIVYGTKNLRVADASVFPLHISGNIQWTVYAVAERAADIVKQGEK